MAVEKAKNIPPFVRFCTASVPMVFDNSMSYYECLCALTKFLQDNVINVINNNAEQLQGLLDGFNELKDYVDNYFANLDVQSEIDAKLDEMAEGGQLATIIAQFLAAAPVFAYGTIAEMAAATNLNNGCIARVLGNTVAANGDGAYYIIRTRIEADDPDGVNLVAIGANLVGVRVQDAAVNDLQEQIDDLRQPTKKYILVADSYGGNYADGGDNVTGWCTRVKTALGLDSDHCTIVQRGGLGFARVAEYNFYTYINALTDDSTVTDVVICGGYNDIGNTYADLSAGIINVITLCNSKFPNAKIHIGCVGDSANASAKAQMETVFRYYKETLDGYVDVQFMDNVKYTLHRYFTMFISDGVHPNNNGQAALSDAIVRYLKYGYADVSYQGGMSLVPVNGGGLTGTWTNVAIMNNGVTNIIFKGNLMSIDWRGEGASAIEVSGKAWTKIADINGGIVIGDNDYSICTSAPCVVLYTNNKYAGVVLDLAIKDKGLYIHANYVTDDGTAFETKNIKNLQIGGISFTTSSLVA